MELEILYPERLLYWCDRIHIPPAGRAPLLEMLAEINADEALTRVFQEFHQATALQGKWHEEWAPLPFDPIVENALGQRTALFYLLAYLAALPYVDQQYKRRGIDPQVFSATLFDISFYYAQDTDISGYWTFTEFAWIWRHLTAQLFRLGRLQFMLIPFEGGVTAFRRRSNGNILILADPAMGLREDGYAAGAGGAHADQPKWYPAFRASPEGWYGHLVSPYGRAQKEQIFLPADQYEVALAPGDTVLDLHIPRGDSLTLEDCRQSFRQAFDFFAWQSPDRPFRASYCHTWFFTPQLQQILGPTSSIVRFQREFYLVPHPGSPNFLWNFVFGKKYPDPASAPRDTTLRRSVLDWLASGKELFDLQGMMFHAPEDWGSQPYMRRWDDSPACFLKE